MNVGVRDLKQNLSKYVEIAAAGEIVTVTDRGVPKATLCPLPQAGGLEVGISEGWIVPAARPRMGLAPFTPAIARRTVADVVAEDRDDR